MALVSNVPPVAVPSNLRDGGDHHSAHAAPVAGQSFASALSQAIGSASQPHAGHGAGGMNDNAGNSSGPGVAPLAPNGDAHPRHFKIGDAHQGEDHGFQELVLGVRAYRQQLIASNIANADTPGYKATDIDFQEALRIARAVSNAPPLSLANTVPGHIQGQPQSGVPPYPLKYHMPLQPSADGNTVEVDVERSKFAENTLMWEFSRDRVSSHFKMTMEMLQNLKD